jgi:excisionase family DNA binding protein
VNEHVSSGYSVERSADGQYTIFSFGVAHFIVKNDPTNNGFLHTNPSPNLAKAETARRPLLKVVEVAEALGLSQNKVYELLAGGELPSIKIDKSRRVRQEDLDAFIEARQTASTRR